MATIKFEFPPLETKQLESVARLLQTIGELMEVTFKVLEESEQFSSFGRPDRRRRSGPEGRTK